ncbi:MAG: hypothetical protein WAM24_06970 [Ignavibacteriaceae bacterium]
MNLTVISFAASYFDQAQFLKNFKYFTGEDLNLFINKKEELFVKPN